jgi:bromodomain-containing factor 1
MHYECQNPYTSHSASTSSKSKSELDQVQLRYCSKMLKNAKRLKNATPFLVPVDPIKLGIPTYFDRIKNPMDISTMQSKLDSNVYANYHEFLEDLNLMFNNCFEFNGREALVSKMAIELQKNFNKTLAAIPKSVS